jgi:hypothetical protein
MRRKQLQNFLLLSVLINSISVANTFAQPFISANAGINLAGDLEFRRGGYGLSAGYLKNKLSVELEMMRHPHFFKDSDMLNYIKDPNIDMNTDAILYTINISYFFKGRDYGRFNPTLSGGMGIYHSWFDATDYLSPLGNTQTTLNSQYDTLDTKQNNLGFHLAAGIMYQLRNKKLKLRSEFRYSYALATYDETGGYLNDFGFLRFSLGLSYFFLSNK